MTQAPPRLPCVRCGSFRIDECSLGPHEGVFSPFFRYKRYRCHRCGWKGWLKPSSYRRRRRNGRMVMERVQSEEMDVPVDLKALDVALSREEARPISPWKARPRHGHQRSRHGRP